MKTVSMMRSLPAPVQLLLVTQLLFNVGFYLVVPFLALHMTESLAASAALVGLVLGLRTFSQQGMFFVGGALADWWGIRPVLLIGIAIRVTGFALAALAPTMALFIVAVILIGFGAALFSPAMDTALAVYGTRITGVTRQELFALDALCSRIGELVGPVVGTALIPLGFPRVAWAGAGLFAAIFVLHLILTPAITTPLRQPVTAGFKEVVSNRAFVVFALAYACYLVGYNQFYQGLPIEVERLTGDPAALGAMFVLASVLSVVAQLPLSRWALRMDHTRALAVGFAIQALAFFWMAAGTRCQSLVGAVGFVVIVTVGQLIAVPVARDTVALLAKERYLGTYFGVLNSFGGCAVLVAATALGPLFGSAGSPYPWLIVAGVLAISGVVAASVSRRV